MKKNKSRSLLFWLLGGCLLSLLCLGFFAAAGAAGLVIYQRPAPALPTRAVAATVPTPSGTPQAGETAPSNPLAIKAAPTSTGTIDSVPATPALDLRPPNAIIQQPVPSRAYSQLASLLAADFPIHDYHEAARRLSSYGVGERTVTTSPYDVGDRQTFYTAEATTEAVLVAVTDHTYFWVEESLSLDPAEVAAAAQRFENDYYPRLINLFGQEWEPGVDNDPHFSVLHLDSLKRTTDELGHFNSGDEYPRSFYSVSNQQEIIYLNMGNLTLGSDLYYGTLVHEYQHLAQWYVDGNETTWLNEGLSQLAEIYLGLDTADSADYLLAPATQLNAWDYASDDVYAHYAAAYLFAVYMWEQLGDAAIQELARHPADGIASVDAVLRGYRPGTTLAQFMADWAAAVYLDDERAGPRYHYRSLDLRSAVTEQGIKFTPAELVKQLPQFSTHYLDVNLTGEATLSFAGDTTAELVPVPPHSGQQMWFAPAQENISAQLTAAFDLSGLNQATLTFWTWYDLKFDLDYVYVAISRDGGQNWELLPLERARPGEHGPALNGRSADVRGAEKGGWVQERISLNSYVGQQVLIRFELLTYYNSEATGFALDDIAIPELGYASDVENGAAGWQPAGFVQIGHLLPQQWAVQFIRRGSPPQVIPLSLGDRNQGQWTLDLGPEGGVLAITALTPYVYEPASYWLYVEQ